ncbi:hypothetical protein M427DRAFT_134057 [Gonapodya prolifera JEL478]|uniref:Uncharacterized protein n=1 Tax=Gonapodya prolifera (strain JEL478) TaxID=1344416 RepID=A0A139AHY4_GONPJ|nr:hypothetical protein M427DRAFT_134057 [Gonapodya prolifera JEL478]|eukprot:KXS16426.1 hypothetical protein M427DRAFT_134057 [Gonapodya prolifera JEL478]
MERRRRKEDGRMDSFNRRGHYSSVQKVSSSGEIAKKRTVDVRSRRFRTDSTRRLRRRHICATARDCGTPDSAAFEESMYCGDDGFCHSECAQGYWECGFHWCSSDPGCGSSTPTGVECEDDETNSCAPTSAARTGRIAIVVTPTTIPSDDGRPTSVSRGAPSAGSSIAGPLTYMSAVSWPATATQSSYYTSTTSSFESQHTLTSYTVTLAFSATTAPSLQSISQTTTPGLLPSETTSISTSTNTATSNLTSPFSRVSSLLVPTPSSAPALSNSTGTALTPGAYSGIFFLALFLLLAIALFAFECLHWLRRRRERGAYHHGRSRSGSGVKLVPMPTSTPQDGTMETPPPLSRILRMPQTWPVGSLSLLRRTPESRTPSSGLESGPRPLEVPVITIQRPSSDTRGSDSLYRDRESEPA